MTAHQEIEGSFRDPAGFVFRRDGKIYRQVNQCYEEQFLLVEKSGLFDELFRDGLLIPHTDAGIGLALDGRAFRVIEPRHVPFISYPHEWCFSQLKDAALLTLEVQKRALGRGLILKDANPCNVQFLDGKPILIDTLSFEKYRQGEPWPAYGQFCRHFLSPLALMAKKDIRLGRLLLAGLDGIPLDMAGRLLPPATWLDFPLLTHIHLHGQSEARLAGKKIKPARSSMSLFALQALTDSLQEAVNGLRLLPGRGEWGGYYDDNSYSPEAMAHKMEIVSGFLDRLRPATLWDLGANAGRFSRAAAERADLVIAMDRDPRAVEMNYQDCRKKGEKKILPLLVDIARPSPGQGWCNREQLSLMERGPADAAMALALVHHLCLSDNIPLGKVARFLSSICRDLLIEFVPKTDSQAMSLFAIRQDIFPGYTRECFQAEMERHFQILSAVEIRDSQRILFLMRKK
jgi:ribosomal protein L11 methylase PrmA